MFPPLRSKDYLMRKTEPGIDEKECLHELLSGSASRVQLIDHETQSNQGDHPFNSIISLKRVPNHPNTFLGSLDGSRHGIKMKKYHFHKSVFVGKEWRATLKQKIELILRLKHQFLRNVDDILITREEKNGGIHFYTSCDSMDVEKNDPSSFSLCAIRVLPANTSPRRRHMSFDSWKRWNFPHTHLPESVILHIGIVIASTLKYLHKRRVAHWDVSSKNLQFFKDHPLEGSDDLPFVQLGPIKLDFLHGQQSRYTFQEGQKEDAASLGMLLKEWLDRPFVELSFCKLYTQIDNLSRHLLSGTIRGWNRVISELCSLFQIATQSTHPSVDSPSLKKKCIRAAHEYSKTRRRGDSFSKQKSSHLLVPSSPGCNHLIVPGKSIPAPQTLSPPKIFSNGTSVHRRSLQAVGTRKSNISIQSPQKPLEMRKRSNTISVKLRDIEMRDEVFPTNNKKLSKTTSPKQKKNATFSPHHSGVCSTAHIPDSDLISDSASIGKWSLFSSTQSFQNVLDTMGLREKEEHFPEKHDEHSNYPKGNDDNVQQATHEDISLWTYKPHRRSVLSSIVKKLQIHRESLTSPMSGSQLDKFSASLDQLLDTIHNPTNDTFQFILCKTQLSILDHSQNLLSCLEQLLWAQIQDPTAQTRFYIPLFMNSKKISSDHDLGTQPTQQLQHKFYIHEHFGDILTSTETDYLLSNPFVHMCLIVEGDDSLENPIYLYHIENELSFHHNQFIVVLPVKFSQEQDAQQKVRQIFGSNNTNISTIALLEE